MLHAISWKTFFELMGSGTLIYYGWLVFRFLPAGFLKNLAGKREGRLRVSPSQKYKDHRRYSY